MKRVVRDRWTSQGSTDRSVISHKTKWRPVILEIHDISVGTRFPTDDNDVTRYAVGCFDPGLDRKTLVCRPTRGSRCERRRARRRRRVIYAVELHRLVAAHYSGGDTRHTQGGAATVCGVMPVARRIDGRRPIRFIQSPVGDRTVAQHYVGVCCLRRTAEERGQQRNSGYCGERTANQYVSRLHNGELLGVLPPKPCAESIKLLRMSKQKWRRRGASESLPIQETAYVASAEPDMTACRA